MAFIKGLMQRYCKRHAASRTLLPKGQGNVTSRRRSSDRDKACACDFVDNYSIKIPRGTFRRQPRTIPARSYLRIDSSGIFLFLLRHPINCNVLYLDWDKMRDKIVCGIKSCLEK